MAISISISISISSPSPYELFPQPTMPQPTDFPPKPALKRKSHTRKLPVETVINMAEARRQIAQALQLHRAASLSTACYNPKPIFSDSQHFCYSMLETMPVPQPTWSTTAPSVLRSPVWPMEEMEIFEWGDGGQASYAWWLGFLKGLDVNSRNQTEYSNAECGSVVTSGEPLFLEPSEHSSFADEWLIIPISEDHGGFLDNNCMIGNDSASN